MQTTIRAQRPHRNLDLDSVNRSRIDRRSIDFAAIFLGLLTLTLLTVILLWQFWHASRIYTGVTVAGVPIGGLTRARAADQLNEQLQSYPLPPVAVEYQGRRWSLTNGAGGNGLIAEVNLTTAVNQAYLVGRQGGWLSQLVAQSGALLAGVAIAPAVTFDGGQIRHFVSQVADDVRRPARVGTQIGAVAVPAQAGVDVNIDATVQSLLATLNEGSTEQPVVIQLAVFDMAPPISSADLESSGQTATSAVPTVSNLALRPPLLISDSHTGIEFAIDSASLAALVSATDPVTVDSARLQTLLETWANQVHVPARDARLQFNQNTGNVSVLRTSQIGRRLDIDATIEAIQQALIAGEPRAPLIIADIPPAVDMNRIAEMGITELVTSGTSYFKGSSAARVHNIEVAAAKFEGVVIPPGEIFSFNTIVEDVSSANGFEDSLVIWGDQTAIGVGGGVCQVSTTVFRAAYGGGMPIVERYNHGYVVGWYGDPGQDATIFTPTVDFRFRNDTDAYLLVDPAVDSVNGIITFNFWGTKPDREVIIGETNISEVVTPDPPVYKLDESLAPGEVKQVEWERNRN